MIVGPDYDIVFANGNVFAAEPLPWFRGLIATKLVTRNESTMAKRTADIGPLFKKMRIYFLSGS